MKNLHDSIAQVRTAVRWVRYSSARLENFKVATRSVGITSKKGLCTNLTTRYNSTFFMLEATQEYKLAFALLGEEDIQYIKYFENQAGLGKPMTEDWDVVSTFVDFLRLFYEITTILSGSLYPTSHHFCQQICKFKVDGMVYGLHIAYGQVWAKHIASRVRETLDRLFDEFTILRYGNIMAPTPIPPPVPDARAEKKRRMDWDDKMEGNPLTRSTPEAKSEIDRYFAWWKVHGPKYPVLAQIARSILVISISTVPLESAFSTRGRVLDPFWSSLDPAAIETLICTLNWNTGSPIHVPDVIDYDHVNADEEGDDAPGSGNVT
ncbi:zinc finger BED domain-containing protein RICESLEEPER 4-like [Carya illinoinensis]|uniref:zinc finger BED domain-containing protein RICESLEEPER 4-like n=1 Tax=Carya illinoinensis TaxID=32201 RepID=UPI001C7280A7|nr:zinc finger BED domain-containing protein RICESLEEPER 4-like [Carya illinoinensis]